MKWTEALRNPASEFRRLSYEWREHLSPDFNNTRFADAYAQLVTYSSLLARLLGAKELDPRRATETLDKNNNLLANALGILNHPQAQAELQLSFGLIQRSLEAVNLEKIQTPKADLWLYFYENFLAEYDPQLRKEYGCILYPAGSSQVISKFSKRIARDSFWQTAWFC